MKLILDTHIWVRWLSSDQPLSEKIVDAIEEAEYLAVSSVSCWEVAYLAKRKRILLPDLHRDPADRFIIATALACNLQLISFDERFKLYDSMKNCLIY